MKRLFLLALVCCPKDPPKEAPEAATPQASASAHPTASADPFEVKGSVLREEITVDVDGTKEQWRFEWRKPPIPVCVDESFETCPCAGFAFGEKGDLDLVRQRPGEKPEVLALDDLFEDKDARLARWPVTKADTGKKPDLANLVMRPLVTVMKPGDYDHDGRATELPLQIAAGPCGSTPTILVGISKSKPHLHAFMPPDKQDPLVLNHPGDWAKLLKSPKADAIQVSCGDHGADQEQVLSILADGELHVTARTRKCGP